MLLWKVSCKWKFLLNLKVFPYKDLLCAVHSYLLHLIFGSYCKCVSSFGRPAKMFHLSVGGPYACKCFTLFCSCCWNMSFCNFSILYLILSVNLFYLSVRRPYAWFRDDLEYCVCVCVCVSAGYVFMCLCVYVWCFKVITTENRVQDLSDLCKLLEFA